MSEILPCPLCGSTDLMHGTSNKEPAVACCECTCRALQSHWQSRAPAPAATAPDAGTHPTHAMRYSDSSYYDEVCTLCGATDLNGTMLAHPCSKAISTQPTFDERAAAFGVILKDEAERLRARADELDPPHSAASTVEPVALATTLEHWAEALRTPTIAEHSVADLAMFNGRCITEDLEDAAKALRAALSRPAHGLDTSDTERLIDRIKAGEPIPEEECETIYAALRLVAHKLLPSALTGKDGSAAS